MWARRTRLAVAALSGIVFAVALIGVRTSGDLVPDAGVERMTGGVPLLLLLASLLVLAGTAIGLIGFRRPVTGPDPVAGPGEGEAVAALVFGIVGLLISVLTPPAVDVGLMGMDDVRASGGRVGDRVLAEP